MIGLDTSLIVRMLVMDDAGQAARVHALMQSLTSESPGFISQVVLVELYWVLSSRYRYDRSQVAHAFELLLRAAGLQIEHRDAVWSALQSFRATGADFTDCLVQQYGFAAGCEYTLTFDFRASKRTGMQLLR